MILHRCITDEQGNRCSGAWHDSGHFTWGLCSGEYPCRFAMAKPGEGYPPIKQEFLDWLRESHRSSNSRPTENPTPSAGADSD